MAETPLVCTAGQQALNYRGQGGQIPSDLCRGICERVSPRYLRETAPSGVSGQLNISSNIQIMDC